MVDRQIAIETVKKLNASGIDLQTIKQTLKGAGLNENEIDSILNESGLTQNNLTPNNSSQKSQNPFLQAVEKNKIESNKPETKNESKFGNNKNENNPFDSNENFDDQEIMQGLSSLEAQDDFAKKIAEKSAASIHQKLDEKTESLEQAGTQLNILMDEHKSMLEEHGEKINGLHSKIDGLHEKLNFGESDSMLSSTDNSLEQRLNEIEIEVKDLKALNLAIQSVVQKILDVNRSVLLKLQQQENK